MLKFISTKINRATDKEGYLRTSIPVAIVRQFRLEEGDILEWIIGIEDDELIVKLKPHKPKDKESKESEEDKKNRKESKYNLIAQAKKIKKDKEKPKNYSLNL